MRKRFIATIVCLMIVASVGTVFAASGVTGNAKTISDIIKNQQVPGNIDEMKRTFKDQIILMTYIRAMDKMMLYMSKDQMDVMTRRFQIHLHTPQMPMETKDEMIISVDQMMLYMTHDQLESMLDITIPMMTKDQMKSLITDNSNAMTMSGVGRLLQ